jgi:hypothetical protein
MRLKANLSKGIMSSLFLSDRPKFPVFARFNPPDLSAMIPIIKTWFVVSLLTAFAVQAATEPPKPQPAPPAKPEPTPPPAKPEPTPAPTPPSAEKKPEPTPVASTGGSSKRKSIEEFTKGMHRVTGLFEFYLDREKGAFFLYVKNDQIGPEFIYFNHTVDSVVQAGRNRGQYGDESIFKISRIFDRVEMIEQNTAFYFDPQSPLARAAQANTSHAVLASEVIVASDAGGVLIPAAGLFLKETLMMVKHPGSDGGKAVLGKLSETKTKLLNIHGYPDNTAVTVEYVYENPAPSWDGEAKSSTDEITDPRYVSVKVQHSLIRMPDNDFKPRYDDPRVGYFSTKVTDLTTIDAAPYRDHIHRWHLAKQKPGTQLSEPVQPIVFWMENTTPVELRDTIREATLKWNEAFETAGFKDAIVVKQQPDNAKWDAGDINYNVLRWTSSPNPPFGGYGPSFVNPRTGQILGADIMLEFSFLTSRMRSQRIFTELGLASPSDESDITRGKDPRFCLDGGFAQQGILFGHAALRLRSGSAVAMKELTRQALTKLILHEVGHTLGLNHNFRASHLYDPVTIHKKEITSKTGLTGSVMDYMPPNLAPEGMAQGEYYITKPGPYDHWAINFGYSEALEDPGEEQKRLEKICARSHERELAFANDADDMRRAGKGIDPRAMIYDMSGDPVVYGIQRCELVKKKLKELLAKEPQVGDSWQSLTQAYLTLTRESADALVAMSRYVGGVQVERAVVGQAPGVKPYTPVAKEKQMAALDALAKYAFAPDAWDLPPDLAAHLQQQRRGFEFSKEDEAPKLHDRVALLHRSLLDQLTHVDTQRRIVDSALYGNEVPLGVVMETLTTAVFEGDPAAGPNTIRQNLQSEYVDRLLKIVNSGSYPPTAQSAAFSQVSRVKAKLEAAPWPNKAYLLYKIRRGLDEP